MQIRVTCRVWTCLILLMGSGLRAATNQTGPDFSDWQSLFSAKAGGGYMENPLYQASGARGVGFGAWGFEWMAVRMRPDAGQITWFTSLDDIRYFDTVAGTNSLQPANGEVSWISQWKWSRAFGAEERWAFSIAPQHAYAKQVFDATDLNGNPGNVRAEGHGLALSPSLRRKLGGQAWIDLEFVAKRQLFQSPISSYWEYGPRLGIGWSLPNRGELKATASHLFRPFDTRRQTDLLGDPLFDTHLRLKDIVTELAWDQPWGSSRHWDTQVRVQYTHRRENGAGYQDLDRFGVRGRLRWKNDKTSVSVSGRWSMFDHPRQFVLVPPLEAILRKRSDWDLIVEGSRELTSHLKATLELRWEEQNSNIDFDSYRARTVRAGLEWEF